MEDEVPYIAHTEFRSGLHRGRFRVVVNPSMARPYVVRRVRLNAALVVCIGVSALLAMSGFGPAGLVLCALGVVSSRLVRHQAGRIVLHLAQNDPGVYAEVTTNGVMEVRRVAA
jgi:hypothetical protein